MKLIIMLSIFFISLSALSQSNWKSSQYNYSIEIPKNFANVSNDAVGANVDFKAVKGNSSIVIVVKKIPHEFKDDSIWEILGDLESFSNSMIEGLKEYMPNPRLIKYGKTTIDEYDSFWLDYTVESPDTYMKSYSFVRNGYLFNITLSCLLSTKSHHESIWYRFKTKIKL